MTDYKMILRDYCEAGERAFSPWHPPRRRYFMTEILTTEQVYARKHDDYCSCGCVDNDDALADSHEALRADRDSWRATAETATEKNVNQALLARHEMREAALNKQLAELQAKYDELEAHYATHEGS